MVSKGSTGGVPGVPRVAIRGWCHLEGPIGLSKPWNSPHADLHGASWPSGAGRTGWSCMGQSVRRAGPGVHPDAWGRQSMQSSASWASGTELSSPGCKGRTVHWSWTASPNGFKSEPIGSGSPSKYGADCPRGWGDLPTEGGSMNRAGVHGKHPVQCSQGAKWG